MPDLTNTLPVSVTDICISLLIGLILGIALRSHFLKFSKQEIKRREIADILPFLALIIILIISIVKSSIALSLGLVGALSIVRFRTPIKDPEELTYIFMAIAIGLSLGANQVFITIIATAFILITMSIFSLATRSEKNQNLNLSIQLGKANDKKIREVVEFVSSLVDRCDLKTIDKKPDSSKLLFQVSIKSADEEFELLGKLSEKYKTSSISISEKKLSIGE